MSTPLPETAPRGLRVVEHSGDGVREAARRHFAAEIEAGGELCFCGACQGFYVADPYPQSCPDCDGCACRVDTSAYYYAFDADAYDRRHGAPRPEVRPS